MECSRDGRNDILLVFTVKLVLARTSIFSSLYEEEEEEEYEYEEKKNCPLQCTMGEELQDVKGNI